MPLADQHAPLCSTANRRQAANAIGTRKYATGDRDRQQTTANTQQPIPPTGNKTFAPILYSCGGGRKGKGKQQGKGKMQAAADDGVSSSNEATRRGSWRTRSSSSWRVRRASVVLDLPVAAAASARRLGFQHRRW
jgi:hypothetical protein